MGWLDDIWNGIAATGQGVVDFLFKPGGSLKYVDGLPGNKWDYNDQGQLIPDSGSSQGEPAIWDGPLDEMNRDFSKTVNDFTDGIGNGINDLIKWLTDLFNGIVGWITDNWWIVAIIGVLVLLLYLRGGVGVGGGAGADDRDTKVIVSNKFNIADKIDSRSRPKYGKSKLYFQRKERQ